MSIYGAVLVEYFRRDKLNKYNIIMLPKIIDI
jgi:hypothetical protein